jgi:hypothetical protein
MLLAAASDGGGGKLNAPFQFDGGAPLQHNQALVERGRLGIRVIAIGLSCLPTAALQEEALTRFLAAFDAGEPAHAWNDLEAEADEWAAWASRRELRAYLVACFRNLPGADRRAFLRRAA